MSRRFTLPLVFLLLTFAVRGQGSPITPEDNPDIAPLIDEIGRMEQRLDTSAFQEWLFGQGREYEQGGEIKHAWHCFEAYRYVTRRLALVDFAVSAESDRRAHWTQIGENLKHIQAFAAGQSRKYPFFGALACDIELFTKSLQLNTSVEIRRRIAEGSSPQMQAKWLALIELRNRIAFMRASLRQAETDTAFAASLRRIGTGSGPGRQRETDKPDLLKMQADSIEKKLQDEERRLIVESAARGDYRVATDFTAEWTDVRDALDEDEALVEFFTYPGPDAKRHYAALIVRPRAEYPYLVPIGPESRITAAMKGRFDFDGLWFEVWRPLEYYLGYAHDIYIAPAGILNAIPFAALHNLGDFIADRYALHNILSGKDLIAGRHRAAPLQRKNALLFGGADFGIEPSDPALESETRPNATRLRSQGFGYLPGSLKEVSDLTVMLRKQGWNTTVFTDTEATEKQFRESIAGEAPEILHISTHGFHIPQPVTDSDSRNPFMVSDEPLMRSGLLFTGANHTWNGGDAPPPDNDGILTGLEIAYMNLSGTKLVVLSACETGLGMIDNSEGVYGLQRAFRPAGAEAMIVSLWKVPDDETARIMTEFYRGITTGKTAKRAFDLAQQEARRRNPYDPYQWAGFIFIE